MSKSRLKLILWALLLVIALSLALAALSGIANLLAYFQQGADPASALNIVPNVPPDLNVSLKWLPDDADTGRAMEPFTRTQIEAAYLRAWLQWNLSYIKGAPYGLKTYFSGPALVAVSANVSDAAKQGLQILQINSAHNLRLHFYSADGSVVAFTDEGAHVSELIRDRKGNLVSFTDSNAQYDVVMLLEDGNWHVRQWVRTKTNTPEYGAIAPLQNVPGIVTVQGKQLMLNGAPYQIAGVNYYPQATPWDKFWTKYDSEIVDADFARMQALGLNTVRIFIPFEQFGGAKVDPNKLKLLDDLLDRADAHGLRVIVTLNDFRADYNPLFWTTSDRQMETLLTRYRDRPTILAWDLKNEPDKDYAAQGRDKVNAWLLHSARLARLYDDIHPLTIGFAAAANAGSSTAPVDLVSFHFYAPANELAKQYATLQAQVGDKPIALQEFGLPTWNSFLFPNGHSEPEQAEYYANILEILRQTEANNYLAWTLYDFSSVPSSVGGRMPWQSEPEKYLGVLHADGTEKPAARLLAPNASLNVPRLPVWSRFLKPFWLTVAVVLLVTSYVGTRVYRRWRKRGGTFRGLVPNFVKRLVRAVIAKLSGLWTRIRRIKMPGWMARVKTWKLPAWVPRIPVPKFIVRLGERIRALFGRMRTAWKNARRNKK